MAKYIKNNSHQNWYFVSCHDKVDLIGATTLLKKFGGWLNLYISVFQQPENSLIYNLPTPFIKQIPSSEEFKFENKTKWSKSQWLLLKVLQFYFNPFYPKISSNRKADILVNYSHPKLKYPTGQSMEIDIFLPDFNLGFEYQGEQHYLDFFLFSADSELIQRRDFLKSEACKRENITLIPIPFWWNREKEVISIVLYLFNFIKEILATIHKYRPDLVSVPPIGVSSISENPPISKLKGSNFIDAWSKTSLEFEDSSIWSHISQNSFRFSRPHRDVANLENIKHLSGWCV